MHDDTFSVSAGSQINLQVRVVLRGDTSRAKFLTLVKCGSMRIVHKLFEISYISRVVYWIRNIALPACNLCNNKTRLPKLNMTLLSGSMMLTLYSDISFCCLILSHSIACSTHIHSCITSVTPLNVQLL